MKDLDGLLEHADTPLPIDSAAAWWERWLDAVRRGGSPVAVAVAAAAACDRLGWAFASGYRAALWALLPGLEPSRRVALAATEDGGVHPRAIETRLAAGRVAGKKRWSTLAPEAESLLVIADEGGEPSTERRQLRLVHVAARGEGVTITPLPASSFVPEISHAEIRFEGALAERVEPGDAWTAYLRPFRTVEDIFVHVAALAYLVRCARARGWSAELVEGLLALLAAGAALAAADPSSPVTHLAIAGWLDAGRALIDGPVRAAWEGGPADDAASRWTRDRRLLDVAGAARARRREKARALLVGDRS